MSDLLEQQNMLQSVEKMISEATDEMDGNWSMVRNGDAPATYTGGMPVYRRRFTMLRDRDEGRYWPYYEHEYQLQSMRAVCRSLGTFTSIAVGAMQALQVYVMGGEWEYEVIPRYEESTSVPDDFIEEVQKVLDEILERNKFVGGLDNEIHDASREDGETLVALFATPDGLVDMRRIDADNLKAPLSSQALNAWLGTDWLLPNGKAAFNWDFGVLTGYDDRMKRIDHERHLGYHLVYDDSGSEFDFMAPWPMAGGEHEGRCLHFIKRNSSRAAKRGISDYFPVLVDFEREDKLNTNVSVVAAALAAITWFEEMPEGTTRTQAESQLSNVLDQYSRAVSQSRNGNERMVNVLKPGTAKIVSAGRKYQEGPLGHQRSTAYTEVRQALIRRIESRWLMPEYMISADASNANYASTLVSTHPFVKAREGEQRAFASEFRDLFAKALKIACDAGRFRRWVSDWQSFVAQIDLLITPPPIATDDKKTLLEQLFGQFDRGAIDANEMRVALRQEAKPELEGHTGRQPGQTAMPFGMSPFGNGQPNGQQQVPPRLEALAAKTIQRLTEIKRD